MGLREDELSRIVEMGFEHAFLPTAEILEREAAGGECYTDAMKAHVWVMP